MIESLPIAGSAVQDQAPEQSFERYPSSAGEGHQRNQIAAKVPRVQLHQMAPNANLIDYDRASGPAQW